MPPLTYQELILRLQTFWAERGCVLQQPYDVEVGAGTMSPETFLRVLGPQPYRVAYVQPSRRPADGRYGENPNRLYKHMQLQVILKPPPDNVQELYLESLAAIGIDLEKHDIKFEEDNWEAPTLGAWGIGWQVMLDGLEITQFTYFQQCGSLDLDPISAELTYGLERIAAFLQDVDSIYDIVWTRRPVDGRRPTTDDVPVTYGQVRLADEQQFSAYNFEYADVEKLWEHLRLYESECHALLTRFNQSLKPRRAEEREGHEFTRAEKREKRTAASAAEADDRPEASGSKTNDLSADDRRPKTDDSRFPVLAAYDLCLKCSHLFNILDARGAISVTERVGLIARIRQLAVGVAKAWVDQQSRKSGGDESRSVSPSSPAPLPAESTHA